MEDPDQLRRVFGQVSAELEGIASLLAETEESLLDFVGEQVQAEGLTPPGELQNLDRVTQFAIALACFFEKLASYSNSGDTAMLHDAIEQIGLVELKERLKETPEEEKTVANSLELF